MTCSETGGDLGPLLQALHLDEALLQKQNTKKQCGTENNCVPVQVGQITDMKIYKKTKNPQLPLLGGREQKWGREHAPCTGHPGRGGQTT